MKSESKRETNDKQLIKSLAKGLTILDIILENGPVSVTKIADILQLNKSSAYRLLSTMKEKGYVEQNPVTMEYDLGIKLLRFGGKILRNISITETVKPYMRQLTGITNETSHLGVLFQNNALIVDREISPEMVSVITDIGNTEPLNCSAIGKVLLSYLPKYKQDEILEQIELKQYTQRTITSKSILKHEIRKVLDNGYAIDDEEYSVGVRCIAAPIFDHNGLTVASIGISGPTSRIRVDNLDKYISAVMDTSKKISQKLGYEF